MFAVHIDLNVFALLLILGFTRAHWWLRGDGVG